MRVGLIGCGSIGSYVAKKIDSGEVPNTELICIYDKNTSLVVKLNEELKNKPLISKSMKQLLDNNLDLVVEAASQRAVTENLNTILSSGLDVLIMSVGALLDEQLLNNALRICSEKNTRIYVPSGAIVGLDGLKSAMSAKIFEVEITSIKPKEAFVNNRFLNEKGVDISKISAKTVVFDGFAREAVKHFPKSVNVCATLSLAGIGAEKTKVKVVVDPNAKIIIHKIRVKGDFGEFFTEVRNVQSPQNPRTSYMACLSALNTLKKLSDKTLQIGT
ncbi:MAG: aspartate dehydrogenase [Methanobacteriota archaeon]